MAPCGRELDVFSRELERAAETVVAFAIPTNSFGIYDEEAEGRLQTQIVNSFHISQALYLTFSR